MRLDVKPIVFLCVKAEIVDVPIFFDNAVECKGQEGIGLGRFLGILIGFGFHDGCKIADSDAIRTRTEQFVFRVMVCQNPLTLR